MVNLEEIQKAKTNLFLTVEQSQEPGPKLKKKGRVKVDNSLIWVEANGQTWEGRQSQADRTRQEQAKIQEVSGNRPGLR